MGSAVPSRRPDRRRRHHCPQHIQIHRLQGPRTPLRKVSVPARPYRPHRFFAENFVNSEITLTFALPNQTKVTDRHGAIAQLVEQRTENPCVPGSIPGGTTESKINLFENQGVGNFNSFFCTTICTTKQKIPSIIDGIHCICNLYPDRPDGYICNKDNQFSTHIPK